MTPTTEQVNAVAEEIVRAARTRESINTLADVDASLEGVGVYPFEPRIIAEAAIKKVLEVCGDRS